MAIAKENVNMANRVNNAAILDIKKLLIVTWIVNNSSRWPKANHFAYKGTFRPLYL